MSNFSPQPEFRDLFELVDRYLAGTTSITGLHGAVVDCERVAKATGASSQVVQSLQDWKRMINRRWNEWGTEGNPISEEEFKCWLEEQRIRLEANE